MSRNASSFAETNSEVDTELDLKDYPGQIKRRPLVGVLLVKICERLTSYTLSGTQKIYLQNQLRMKPSTATALNSVFSMLCFFWCIPGGLLADSIGRYKTIIAAASTYAVGAVCVGISVTYALQSSLSWLFMLGSLVLVAMGIGGIEPNLPTFGADQIGDNCEKQRECQKTFFSVFYFCDSISLLMAFGFMTNTTTFGIPGIVSPSHGYSFAYGSGAACIILAAVIFASSIGCYRILPGNGLAPVRCLVKYHYYSVWNGGGWRAGLSLAGFLCLPCFYVVTVADTLFSAFTERSDTKLFQDPCAAPFRIPPPSRSPRSENDFTGFLTHFALALGAMACIFIVVANVNCSWVPDLPRASFAAKDARRTFAAIPLIIVVDVALGFCGNSLHAAFPSQACQMNLQLGTQQLNGAFFNIAEALATVTFTPIFESCLYPLIALLKGSPVRLGQKIIAGLVIAIISQVVAAVLETLRKQAPCICDDSGFSQCAPFYDNHGLVTGTRMRDISAFWIFIPYGLFGIAEVLIIPSMYCFAYDAAPSEVRSLLQAFNLFFACSVSNAFTAGVSKLLYPNDLDAGSLETFYLVNATLSASGLGVYFLITRCRGQSHEIEPVIESIEDCKERGIELQNNM